MSAAPTVLIALVLAFLACTPSTYAQAPGPAPAPAPPNEPPPRLEAAAQVTFVATRGNASSQTLGAGGDLTWRPDPWTYAAKAVFAQVETDDELAARSLAALFRASRAFDKRLSTYGQYDFLRDLFAGVEHRNVIEGGVSYLARDVRPHRLRLDAGLGYLYEQRPDDDFDSATASLGAAYRFNISDTSDFTYEPRFLLPFAEAGAWRFDQNAALTVALNSVLALRLAHTLRYSAEPPEGFEKTDTIMAVSLVAKLRRPN